jgi:hypothetical protein
MGFLLEFTTDRCSCALHHLQAVDSIGLGFGANSGYSVYSLATTSGAATEQWLVARAQTTQLASSATSYGWSMSLYFGVPFANRTADLNGSFGFRAYDFNEGTAGAYFSAQSTRTRPQIYSFVARPTAGFGTGPSLWFQRPRIFGGIDGAVSVPQTGFYGSCIVS